MVRLSESPWDYIVWEHEGRIYLDVLCGTVAIYDVVVELDATERMLWETEGAAGLLSLIQDIRYRPQDFQERRVSLPG